MADVRTTVSLALAELAIEECVWVTWPTPPLRLLLRIPRAEDVWSVREVVFVHASRFGLGTLVEKNGPRVSVRGWLDGRPGPRRLFVRDVRAVVLESHPRGNFEMKDVPQRER